MSEGYTYLAGVYDKLMGNIDYGAWMRDTIGRLEGLAPHMHSVVDCGCGTGRATIALAKAGYNVIGVDISEQMLMIAQENARKAGTRINFIAQDMASLKLHKPVDAIIAVCDGVNYLTSIADVKRFFIAAYNALTPGGVILFDISSPEKLEHVLGGNTFAADEDDVAYIWSNTFDRSTRLIMMDLTLFLLSGKTYVKTKETHIQRAHTPRELQATLAQVGFTEISYESMQTPGNTLLGAGDRVVFTARR